VAWGIGFDKDTAHLNPARAGVADGGAKLAASCLWSRLATAHSFPTSPFLESFQEKLTWRVSSGMKTILLSLTITLVFGIMSIAFAIRYHPAKDLEVKSPNGIYTLRVSAQTSLHEVIKDNKVLWTFERDVWHNDYFLSNDGQRVLWVVHPNFHVMGEDSAVIVYAPEGVILKKSVDQISIPDPSSIGGVISIWREGATQEGNVVTIDTLGRPACVINLANLPEA
jgi:hypothetical protein